MAVTSRQAGAILRIDLSALAANYDLLNQRAGGAECAAVLKADAYGLGAQRVAPVLAAAGCTTFFVAHLAEGIDLRQILGPDPTVYILNGPLPETAGEFLAHELIPVLNSPQQIAQWAKAAANENRKLAAALHFDTGMARLGLTPAEADQLAQAPDLLAGIDLRLVVSHLACADEPEHPLNQEQQQQFAALLPRQPPAPASLANSSGIFLGPDFHFDLVRPGIALYGGNPTPRVANPMAEVVRLQARIIQVREIDTPQSVGYGATYRAPGPRRIATLPVGYADGYLRALSGQGVGNIAGISVPIVGRVSMDLITLDVTDVPPADCEPGALADLIGGDGPALDEVAAAAGTIGYEILTSLGGRYHRQYLNNAAGEAGHE